VTAKTNLLILAALLAACVGCGYDDVSPESYEYVIALYSITNRQDTNSLETLRGTLEAATGAGELARHEAGLLLEIVQCAADGDWKQANRDCRRLLDAQVKGR
jgi:hypothetical protein